VFERLRDEHGFTGGYLPRATIATTRAASYMTLLARDAA